MTSSERRINIMKCLNSINVVYTALGCCMRTLRYIKKHAFYDTFRHKLLTYRGIYTNRWHMLINIGNVKSDEHYPIKLMHDNSMQNVLISQSEVRNVWSCAFVTNSNRIKLPLLCKDVRVSSFFFSYIEIIISMYRLFEILRE